METVKNSNKHNLENSVGHAGEFIENAKEMGSEYLEAAKEKGLGLLTAARRKAEKKWGQATGFVQEHPLQALGYAALFGAALAVLLYPRKRD